MATIDNLHKSISEKSDEELIHLLKDVRASRRITKKSSKAQNTTIKKSAAAAKAVKGLPQSDLAALISELEGEI